jgi:hypothetical protein
VAINHLEGCVGDDQCKRKDSRSTPPQNRQTNERKVKFRKKPVIIEAVQLRWDTWSEMCEHAKVGFLEDGKPEGCFIGLDGKPLPHGQSSSTIGMIIPTLEGLMLAREGDWVIRGVNGELYPCKPDIFEKTYEKVEN